MSTDDDGALPEGTVTADTVCPHCARHNPQHLHPSLQPPADGDYTVCWGCGAVLTFTVSPLGVIGVAALDAAGVAEALTNADVREALAARAESYTPVQALALRQAGGRYQ